MKPTEGFCTGLTCRAWMSIFQDPRLGLRETTSGQKAQFKHYEKKRVRQKNGGRKMKMARFAQRRGGASYISATDFSAILFEETRISFCADP
ncbi:MAG: hypothetical protein ACLQVY_14675 [Limisphaerales bacterium]